MSPIQEIETTKANGQGLPQSASITRKAVASNSTPSRNPAENTETETPQTREPLEENVVSDLTTTDAVLAPLDPIIHQSEEESADDPLQREIDRIREERENLSRLIELGRLEERLRQ